MQLPKRNTVRAKSNGRAKPRKTRYSRYPCVRKGPEIGGGMRPSANCGEVRRTVAGLQEGTHGYHSVGWAGWSDRKVSRLPDTRRRLPGPDGALTIAPGNGIGTLAAIPARRAQTVIPPKGPVDLLVNGHQLATTWQHPNLREQCGTAALWAVLGPESLEGCGAGRLQRRVQFGPCPSGAQPISGPFSHSEVV